MTDIPAMSDVQGRYRQVASSFDSAVRATTPGRWDAQSPCEEWRARDVVAGHRGVVAGVRGGESKPLRADEDLQAAWDEVSKAVDEIAGDPQALAKEVDGPLGKMPAGQIIGQFVTMDLLVHTWAPLRSRSRTLIGGGSVEIVGRAHLRRRLGSVRAGGR